MKTIFAQFLGKYRVVSALFGKIERLTFTGTFDAFQHLVKSHSFKQICFPHRSEMGVLKSFLQLSEESDGTKRLLDLIPAFAKLKKGQGTVFVIDELDRSLHTQLLEWLLKYFLDVCHADSRNQLIFTTHDVNILTQDLFRRDELWGIDKNPDGAPILYSFRDFKKNQKR